MQQLNRLEKILTKVKLDGKGLEIGPLCWPILSKDTTHIQYVDHVSREKLLEIYKDDPGVLPELIQDVDFPLNGRTLAKTIPNGEKFDYILASHVIEHVPDVISWLQDTSSVLKEGGVLSLVVPDKRYTFDIDRNTSRLGDVVGPYVDGLSRPYSSTVFDHVASYRIHTSSDAVWNGELYLDESKAPHRNTIKDAFDISVKSKNNYIDSHNFVFTPYSFCEIIRSLIKLDLIDYKIVSFFETEKNTFEFIVTLQKTAKSSSIQNRLQKFPQIKPDPVTRVLLSEAAEREVTIKELRQTIRIRDDSIVNITNSKSWILTKPLRYLNKLLKKFT